MKRPQESVLANFMQSAQNLDVAVVFSILYYVWQEQQMEWISKLVNLSESTSLRRFIDSRSQIF